MSTEICPRPADPQYGYVFSPRTKREYVEDESIRYRCNTGYCMRGNPIAYCRHTGFTRAPSCGGLYFITIKNQTELSILIPKQFPRFYQ